MEWNPPDAWLAMGDWLRGLAATIAPPPAAILVISAHWEAAQFSVMDQASPALLYDYYGFPEHTYRLEYPASGSPALAQRVAELLAAAAIEVQRDRQRGFDHGVFIPFKLIYPQADIPIVQLSLRNGLDPAAHLALGRALAPLRSQGVLIVGSGMSYHNMQGIGAGVGGASDQFDAWLTETVEGEPAQRDERLREWQRAPAARIAHPREEHLLPLLVVAGAAGADRGQRVFSDRVMGCTVAAHRFG
jgi:aromatic ring-opening dioxygenase catalytic subunit (LigB family)